MLVVSLKTAEGWLKGILIVNVTFSSDPPNMPPLVVFVPVSKLTSKSSWLELASSTRYFVIHSPSSDAWTGAVSAVKAPAINIRINKVANSFIFNFAPLWRDFIESCI